MFKYIAVAKVSANELGIPVRDASTAAIGPILNQVYMVAGIIGVIVIIIAGFMYTVSAGDPGKTKKAKDAILYAVVGLIVIILAFTITQIVMGAAV